MIYMNRDDLLIAAGESIKMQCNAAIKPIVKVDKSIWTCDSVSFTSQRIDYEFPIAVVEGKAVFVGDTLYCCNGDKCTIREITNGATYALEGWSWNPPKPKTVMVELPLVLAEHYALLADGNHSELLRACKKSLENSK